MSPSFNRFLLAMLLAPIAGGATSAIGTALWVLLLGKEAERNLGEAWHVAVFVGFWALLVCAAYVIVLGLAIYFYVRIRRARIGLSLAILAGVLGSIPFILPVFKDNAAMTKETFFIPILAVLSALVTAYTFWRIALAPGPASVSQS